MGKSKKCGKKSSGNAGNSGMSDLMDELSLLSPEKRHKLKAEVDKLLDVSGSSSLGTSVSVSQLWTQHESLFQSVQNIRGMEMELNLNRRIPADRSKALDKFITWIQSNGGYLSEDLSLQDYGAMGYGLRVGNDLKYGKEVMKIPRKLMMTTESAADSSIGPLIQKDSMLRTMSNVVLALHLLIEKNSPASFWEPYINTLPTSYSTVLYYTPEEFLELKGSPAYEDALKQYRFVARQYAYFYTKFQGTMLRDYFTYDEYRWAVSTVMTRQNQIPGTKDSDGLKVMINSLIPLWDMCNHEDNGVISTDFDVETDLSRCMANRDFKSGEQFTIYYGVRANIDLLIHNGFVPEKNVSDTLTIKLGVARKDPLFNVKMALLEKLTVPTNGNYYLGNGDKPIDGKIMAFLRVNSMTSSETIEKWTADESCRELLDLIPNDGSLNEIDGKAINFISVRCQLLLKSYPSTMEQDAEILKEEASINKKYCVVLRMKEKEILTNTIEYCKILAS